MKIPSICICIIFFWYVLILFIKRRRMFLQYIYISLIFVKMDEEVRKQMSSTNKKCIF